MEVCEWIDASYVIDEAGADGLMSWGQMLIMQINWWIFLLNFSWLIEWRRKELGEWHGVSGFIFFYEVVFIYGLMPSNPERVWRSNWFILIPQAKFHRIIHNIIFSLHIGRIERIGRRTQDTDLEKESMNQMEMRKNSN